MTTNESLIAEAHTFRATDNGAYLEIRLADALAASEAEVGRVTQERGDARRIADDAIAQANREKVRREGAEKGWDESTEAWGIVQAHPAVEQVDGKLVDHVMAALDRGVTAREECDGLAAVIAGVAEELPLEATFELPESNEQALNAIRDKIALTPAATLAARDAEKWDEGRLSVGLDFLRPTYAATGIRAATPNPYRTPKQGEPEQ